MGADVHQGALRPAECAVTSSVVFKCVAQKFNMYT
jgi:hypothetical protein